MNEEERCLTSVAPEVTPSATVRERPFRSTVQLLSYSPIKTVSRYQVITGPVGPVSIKIFY